MPAKMPAGLMDLLARKNKQIASHTTLSILIDNGDILRHYRFASARLIIDGAVYEPQLRKGSQIKSSLTQAADRGSVALQNVDTELGKEFLGLGDALYGAESTIGRFWKDLDSGAEFHKEFLTGPLISMKPDENFVTLTVISEPYSHISVGAARSVAPLCQWLFRQPTTCGFAGSQQTCNLMLNHIDGCEGRHGGGTGNSLKRAKFGGDPYVNSGSRLTAAS